MGAEISTHQVHPAQRALPLPSGLGASLSQTNFQGDALRAAPPL